MSAGRRLKGAEYQNGPLAGIGARSYLFAAGGRACAYCGATGTPLNIDHVHPVSRGGSSKLSNVVLACVPRIDSLRSWGGRARRCVMPPS
ncbi:HNH endonuclease [Streptomyces sp. NPDC048436]|uniref:HNH endonuclease n=1 Tax=Streptomyces sp. NPDC048436 TaxID=3365550 RepID=UPI003723A7EF